MVGPVSSRAPAVCGDRVARHQFDRCRHANLAFGFAGERWAARHERNPAAQSGADRWNHGVASLRRMKAGGLRADAQIRKTRHAKSTAPKSGNRFSAKNDATTNDAAGPETRYARSALWLYAKYIAYFQDRARRRDRVSPRAISKAPDCPARPISDILAARRGARLLSTGWSRNQRRSPIVLRHKRRHRSPCPNALKRY